jgi:hypothetical protein
VRPAGLEAAAPCQVPDQKQRQWWLGTKWESRALAGALSRSVLLTCARLHLRKYGNDLVAGNVDAFLGVKGSPVQIRPSRLVFRTLVPRIGNENCHDRSHLTGRVEQSIQGGRHAILLIALPRWPRSRRGGPVRYLSSHSRRGWAWPSTPWRNSWPSAGAGAGVQAAQALPFRRRTHRPPHPDARRKRDHGALPDPPCGGREWRVRRRGRCYDPRRRQPLGRMPATYRRVPPATRLPNVARTSSDAHISRANTRARRGERSVADSPSMHTYSDVRRASQALGRTAQPMSIKNAEPVSKGQERSRWWCWTPMRV